MKKFLFSSFILATFIFAGFTTTANATTVSSSAISTVKEVKADVKKVKAEGDLYEIVDGNETWVFVEVEDGLLELVCICTN